MLKKLIKENKIISSILVFFVFVMIFSTKGTTAPLSTSMEVENYLAKEIIFIGTPLEFSRARTHYMQMVALYNRNTLEFTEHEAFLTRPDAGYLNGKFHSVAIFGISLFMYPFFFLGTFVGLEQLMSIIPLYSLHGVNIFLFFILLNGLFKNKALSGAGALLFGFATLLLPFASSPLYHNFSILFVLTLFLLTKKISESPDKAFKLFLISSTLIGISVFIDYPIPLILLPFYFYQIILLRRQNTPSTQKKTIKTLLYSFCIAAFCLSGLLFVQNKMFGNPFQMANTQIQYVGKNTVTTFSDEFLKSRTAEKNSLKKFVNKDNITKNFSRVFIAKDKGLLILSPILFLAFFGIFFARKQKILKPILIPLALSTLISFLLYTAFIGGRGDHSIGIRYMIPLIPLFLIFVVSALKEIREVRILRIPLIVGFFWTFFSHFSGLFTTIYSKMGDPFHKYGIMQYDYLMAEITSSFWFKHVYWGLPLPFYPILLAIIATSLTTYFLYHEGLPDDQNPKKTS